MTTSLLSTLVRLCGSGDWLWGGVGLGMAGASATFAAYMVATAPSEVTGSGSKDWTIFANLTRRSPSLGRDDQRPAAQAAPTATATAVDPNPTGSIGTAGTGRDAPKPRASRSTPLRGYILRDANEKRALIEHSNKLSLVQPGSSLDDAGEVLAIERRGDAWIVKTEGGIIGGS